MKQPIDDIKTDTELDALYEDVSNGLTTLHNQSEAWGDDISKNRARLLFFALAMQLEDKGILEHLVAAAKYARQHGKS